MAQLSNDDEYATFDFAEFTEEDFKQIDEQLAHRAGPELSVELDTSVADVHNYPNEGVRSSKSPLLQFRREGILSVTDLSALMWCEVQFDYGLRQRRSRPLAARPPSFVSREGKTISVQAATAVKNEQIQSKGRAIHKVLEKEIPMEEVKVTVSYPEERWALRLVNMMACINCLLDFGIAREMPVFGIINGVMVTGIIDEITREPLKPKSTKVSSRKEETPPPSQARITEFLSPGKQKAAQPIEEASTAPLVNTHSLHISDTKTRKTNNLPPHPDTLPARVQVMLYRRLLNELLSPVYDFGLLWAYLDLTPTRTLSPEFLQSSGLLWQDPSVTCLDDISHLWSLSTARLNVQEVDPSLKLVYRLQPEGLPRKHAASRVMSPHLLSIQEDKDLKAAIEASLRDLENKRAADAGTEIERVDNAPIPPIDDPAKKLKNSHTGQIIGTKKFIYKEDFLNDHLTRALEWWLGQRNPEGVSVEDSRRCFSCEYAEDCEWREKKAMEFRDHISEKRREAGKVAR